MALLFVMRLFNPDFLKQKEHTLVVNNTEPAQLATPAGSYRHAAKKAMPSVVNIFTTKAAAPNPHERFLDDPVFRHFLVIN